LPILHDSRILSGLSLADDAGIYRLTDELALIQTLDFFTPVVDDPYTYGQIAAANALSDVYAMGGTPLTALNVAVYPTKTLPLSILSDILRGGSDKASEAGVSIIGGHTVEGTEPMYGLAVTGTVNPDRIVKPSGGQSGDVLVLTKPIGTGVIATALKAGAAKPEHVAEAARWMLRLNRTAADCMNGVNAHSSTDVTGFGLIGHVSEMARASGLAVELDSAAVPALSGALQYATDGFVPRGGQSNLEHARVRTEFSLGVSETLRILMTDPQTSGGLVMAVAPAQVARLTANLKSTGDVAWTIGRLVAGDPGHANVR